MRCLGGRAQPFFDEARFSDTRFADHQEQLATSDTNVLHRYAQVEDLRFSAHEGPVTVADLPRRFTNR